MDAFDTIRTQLAKQAAHRNQLIDYVNGRTLAPIPATSATPLVTTESLAERAKDWRMIDTYRNQLVRKHRVNTRKRHAVIDAYWGDHTDAVRETLLNREDSLARGDWETGEPYSITVTRSILTRQARNLIRMIRDHEVRAIHATSINALINPDADAVVTPTTSKPWKGLVNGTEVRVNTRGAYGKRGIKGAGTRVSQRDNYVPTFILKPLPLCVGVATHPDASASDYDALLLTIRTTPMLATYRRYSDASDAIGTVIPVHAPDASDDATARPKRSSVKPSGRVESDVAAQARFGTIHDSAA